MGLLEELQSRVLTADGAIGTLLYSNGLDFCHEEMNVSRPDIIEKIHRQYIEAGADIIQTNTYGARQSPLRASLGKIGPTRMDPAVGSIGSSLRTE